MKTRPLVPRVISAIAAVTFSSFTATAQNEVPMTKLMLADARADLARDFADIIRKYSDLQTERTRIFSLKNNLAAREQWLEKNPPPATNN